MRLNKIFITMLALVTVVFVTSCVQYTPAPRGEDTDIPELITNIQIENLHGEVRLTYQLPNDPTLLYVRAEYLLNSGVKREVKASYYTNTMLLEGFGDTEKHEVKLYSVSRNEIESEPIVIEVEPLENPIFATKRSLTLGETFGGVWFHADNPTEDEIAIEVHVKDSIGNWQKLTDIVSSAPVIDRAHRGMDTLSYDLSVTVRDRFLNYTDTTYHTIKPIHEVELDKSKFKHLNLPGEAKSETPTWLEPECMWDNLNGPDMVTRWLGLHTSDPSPTHISFDTGVVSKLSRFVWWGYGYDGGYMIDGRRQFFIGEHMRFFEIWGSNDPDPDGSFDSWTLLASFETIKPSGLPIGQQTNEDYEAGVLGHEFIFPADVPEVRYLRIRNIQNFSGHGKFGIVEIALFGSPR